MFARLVTKLLLWWMNKTTLSLDDRILCTAMLLEKLQAVPLHAILEPDEQTGELLVQGRPLSIEKARQLREYAEAALRNQALNLIREQVMYETFVGAATKSAQPYDLIFYRAALWWGQQVEKHLHTLAQRHEEVDL